MIQVLEHYQQRGDQPVRLVRHVNEDIKWRMREHFVELVPKVQPVRVSENALIKADLQQQRKRKARDLGGLLPLIDEKRSEIAEETKLRESFLRRQRDLMDRSIQAKAALDAEIEHRKHRAKKGEEFTTRQPHANEESSSTASDTGKWTHQLDETSFSDMESPRPISKTRALLGSRLNLDRSSRSMRSPLNRKRSYSPRGYDDERMPSPTSSQPPSPPHSPFSTVSSLSVGTRSRMNSGGLADQSTLAQASDTDSESTVFVLMKARQQRALALETLKSYYQDSLQEATDEADRATAEESLNRVLEELEGLRKFLDSRTPQRGKKQFQSMARSGTIRTEHLDIQHDQDVNPEYDESFHALREQVRERALRSFNEDYQPRDEEEEEKEYDRSHLEASTLSVRSKVSSHGLGGGLGRLRERLNLAEESVEQEKSVVEFEEDAENKPSILRDERTFRPIIENDLSKLQEENVHQTALDEEKQPVADIDTSEQPPEEYIDYTVPQYSTYDWREFERDLVVKIINLAAPYGLDLANDEPPYILPSIVLDELASMSSNRGGIERRLVFERVEVELQNLRLNGRLGPGSAYSLGMINELSAQLAESVSRKGGITMSQVALEDYVRRLVLMSIDTLDLNIDSPTVMSEEHFRNVEAHYETTLTEQCRAVFLAVDAILLKLYPGFTTGFVPPANATFHQTIEYMRRPDWNNEDALVQQVLGQMHRMNPTYIAGEEITDETLQLAGEAIARALVSEDEAEWQFSVEEENAMVSEDLCGALYERVLASTEVEFTRVMDAYSQQREEEQSGFERELQHTASYDSALKGRASTSEEMLL